MRMLNYLVLMSAIVLEQILNSGAEWEESHTWDWRKKRAWAWSDPIEFDYFVTNCRRQKKSMIRNSEPVPIAFNLFLLFTNHCEYRSMTEYHYPEFDY